MCGIHGRTQGIIFLCIQDLCRGFPDVGHGWDRNLCFLPQIEHL
jgi:hypothetical protein